MANKIIDGVHYLILGSAFGALISVVNIASFGAANIPAAAATTTAATTAIAADSRSKKKKLEASKEKKNGTYQTIIIPEIVEDSKAN